MTPQDRELYQQDETDRQAEMMSGHGDIVTEEDFMEWNKQRNATDQAQLQPSPEAGGSVCHAKFGHHKDHRPHHCLLPAGHDGMHFCYICGLYWYSPNKCIEQPTSTK